MILLVFCPSFVTTFLAQFSLLDYNRSVSRVSLTILIPYDFPPKCQVYLAPASSWSPDCPSKSTLLGRLNVSSYQISFIFLTSYTNTVGISACYERLLCACANPQVELRNCARV